MRSPTEALKQRGKGGVSLYHPCEENAVAARHGANFLSSLSPTWSLTRETLR